MHHYRCIGTTVSRFLSPSQKAPFRISLLSKTRPLLEGPSQIHPLASKPPPRDVLQSLEVWEHL